MAIDYQGNLDELKELMSKSGIQGTWTKGDGGKQIFKSRMNGVLNYWPHKGTVQLQGKERAKQELSEMFDVQSNNNAKTAPSTDANNVRTKIFVVHGHDTPALEQLELVLRRLGLDPYILQNNDGESKTIIEALEQKVYREAAFGIILMTPDDYGYSKSSGEAGRQPRARQNVILELGMVLASLGRERMVLLKKGALEIPTDINGVIYLEFNEHVKEVAVKLATRIKAAGIDIDDKLIHVASA